MNNEEATTYIVQELTRHHSRNEIIVHLCQQMGIDWTKAEQLVQDVEAQHGHAIAVKQSPFMLFLSGGIIVIGLAMLIYSAVFFIDFSHMDLAQKALALRSSYYRAGTLLTGLGMIVGGIIGLTRTLSVFLAKPEGQA